MLHDRTDDELPYAIAFGFGGELFEKFGLIHIPYPSKSR